MATQDIFNAIMEFDEEKVRKLTQAEVAAGTDLGAILNQGLIGAMDTVGEKFSAGDLFVPEMLMAAQAMKAGLEVLKPLLATGQSHSKGRVVIGTVKGDLHDIGKNLVGMMLKGANFEIFDLGTNVSVDKFMDAAREHKADVIGISALLTTTMGGMRGVIEAVRAADDLPHLKVMVGGAAVTKEFAEQIGADGWAPDAGSAVILARRLVAEARAEQAGNVA